MTAIAFAYDPEKSEQAGRTAAAAFEKRRRRGRGVRSARTTTISGSYDLFGRIARHFDLAVISQDEPDKAQSEELVVEGALFESGRPMVMVPYIHKSGLKLERVMVCWDGSRPAARAVADAMPLLSRARKVDVVVVAPTKIDEMPGADAAEHLARHGLDVTVERIARANLDVNDALLNFAADSGADLVVMGGYRHSRMREFVLGGTTRAMLTSMTVSH